MKDDCHGGIDRKSRGELWTMRKRALKERRREFQAKWAGVNLDALNSDEKHVRDWEQYFCFYPKDLAPGRHLARAHW